MKLTVKGIERIIKEVKETKKAKKSADGEGLYIEITPTGGQYWRMKYRYMGREKRLAFGVYPNISLQEAREQRRLAKKLLEQGIDPSVQKRLNKLCEIDASQNTFEVIAREWIELKSAEWSDGYCKTIETRLERDLFPQIGGVPITLLNAPRLLSTLKEIEARGVYETTKRARQYCSQIFQYAISSGRAENDPTLVLNKALKTKSVEHFKALPLEELPNLLHKLNQNDARLFIQTRLALKLLILTFLRKKELSHARWDEINLKEKIWIIPAARMKMKKDHLVPLSHQAIEIMEELFFLNERWEYVFPSQKTPKKPMDEDTILRAFYRLGYKGTATIHGFRALAMSTIKEKLGYRHEVPDRQLAHARRNSVDSAYDRAEFLEDRKKMMQDWADYLDEVSRFSAK